MLYWCIPKVYLKKKIMILTLKSNDHINQKNNLRKMKTWSNWLLLKPSLWNQRERTKRAYADTVCRRKRDWWYIKLNCDCPCKGKCYRRVGLTFRTSTHWEAELMHGCSNITKRRDLSMLYNLPNLDIRVSVLFNAEHGL